MKTLFLTLTTLLLSFVAQAADLMLEWDAPTPTNGIIGYRVVLNQFGRPPFLTNVVNGTLTTSNQFIGLFVGTNYVVEVRSMNSATLWSDASITNFTPVAGVPNLRLRNMTQVAPGPEGPWIDDTNVVVMVTALKPNRFYRSILQLELEK